MGRHEGHEVGGDWIWLGHLQIGGLEGGPVDVDVKVKPRGIWPARVSRLGRSFSVGLGRR